MANNLTDRICEFVKPTIESLGLQLWGCELMGSGMDTVLRIYIDKDDGITVDNCAEVSHQVSGILDVEDVIKEHYTLEVSSPGINRPLFTSSQFAKYIGQTIRVRLNRAIDNRRNYLGKLDFVNQDTIKLIIDNETFELPIENIDKAKLVTELRG